MNTFIVFDLDETLGHFSQPYKFWYHLKKFLRLIKGVGISPI